MTKTAAEQASEWNAWNQKIIDEFRANGGRVGGPFEGAPMILVHHLGAKSGTERVTPLVCFPQADGGYLIVASKGGAPTNPDWYHNLKAHPKIEVEIGTETFTVLAEELPEAERDAKWPTIIEARPGFAEYETMTSRKIPIIRLTPQTPA